MWSKLLICKKFKSFEKVLKNMEPEEAVLVSKLEEKLTEIIERMKGASGAVFIKTSCRSAKDTAIFDETFRYILTLLVRFLIAQTKVSRRTVQSGSWKRKRSGFLASRGSWMLNGQVSIFTWRPRLTSSKRKRRVSYWNHSSNQKECFRILSLPLRS